MTKSTTTALIPLIRCLKAAKVRVGRVAWEPKTEDQEYIVGESEDEINWDFFSEEEIITKLADNADELNEFAKNHGFDIRLEPFEGPLSFGVASLLHVVLKWFKEADEHDIGYEGEVYKGMQMKDNYAVYESTLCENPVCRVGAQNVYYVYMTKLDSDLFGMELNRKVLEITNEVTSSHFSSDITDMYPNGVVFPEIECDHIVEQGELRDMVGNLLEHASHQVTIVQALQQTKLKMDRKGVEVKSLGMMEMTISGCGPGGGGTLYINGPFLFWIMRPGVTTPIVAANLKTDTWLTTGREYDQNAPKRKSNFLILEELIEDNEILVKYEKGKLNEF